mmetsp:Transcript_6901/g.7889  ORF Transcript_6901/g.7889 Transcript_6901/m.7889 type:complete len:224 (+) Transcript_6901:223-894(+)
MFNTIANHAHHKVWCEVGMYDLMPAVICCPFCTSCAAHFIYLFKNLRWKSFLMVSLMNRCLCSGSFRVWFLKTTSSSHLRLTLKPSPSAPSFAAVRGLPTASSAAFASAASFCASASFLAASSARSFFILSSSANNSFSSSSLSSSLSSSSSDSSASAALGPSRSSVASFLSPPPGLALGPGPSNARMSPSSASARVLFFWCFDSLSSSSSFKSRALRSLVLP